MIKEETQKKLENISKVAKIVSKILKILEKETKIGKTGLEMEKIAKKIMEENNVFSSSFNYENFPNFICVSVSNKEDSVLTHGIPNDIPFEKNDLVSFDVACYYQDEEKKKYHADAAITTIVEGDCPAKKKLIETTKKCLEYTIEQIIPNKTTTKDIGRIIQTYAENRNYKTIKEFGGHGIGNELHEPPFIPNHRRIFNEEIIKPGMFICIEPLIQEKDDKIVKKSVADKNGKKWDIICSKNGFLNAHFEHTIYIDEERANILTN